MRSFFLPVICLACFAWLVSAPAWAQPLSQAQTRAARERAVPQIEAALKEAEGHSGNGLPGAWAIGLIRTDVALLLDNRASVILSAEERAAYSQRFTAAIDMALRPYVAAKRAELLRMPMGLRGAVALVKWQTSLDQDVSGFRTMTIPGIFALNQEGSLDRLRELLAAGITEFRELMANYPTPGRDGLTGEEVTVALSLNRLATGLDEAGWYRRAYIEGRRAADVRPTSTTSVAGLVADPKVRDDRDMRLFLTGDVVKYRSDQMTDLWWFALGIHNAMAEHCAAVADRSVGLALSSDLDRVAEREETRNYLRNLAMSISTLGVYRPSEIGGPVSRSVGPRAYDANQYMTSFIQNSGGCSGKLASTVYGYTKAFALRDSTGPTILWGPVIIQGEWVFRRAGQPSSAPAFTLRFEPLGGARDLPMRVTSNAWPLLGGGTFGSTPGNPGGGGFIVSGDSARLRLDDKGVMRMMILGRGRTLPVGDYEGVRAQ